MFDLSFVGKGTHLSPLVQILPNFFFLFCFVLCSAFTTVELRSKLLSLDNKSKKNPFFFVLCSLNRNFVPTKRRI